MRKSITFNAENPIHKEAIDILVKIGKPYNDFVAQAIISYFTATEGKKTSEFDEKVMTALENNRERIEIIVKDTMLMIFSGSQKKLKEEMPRELEEQDDTVLPECSVKEIPEKNAKQLASIFSDISL